VGRRRIGLAISDASGTLARPLATLTLAASDTDAGVARLAAEITRLEAEDDGLAAVVIGMPRHLDGTPSAETSHVTSFAAALGSRTRVPIVSTDERLTSVEAEERLAARERDWKRRKEKLDAAAAAIILQDYLDRK